MKKILKKIIPNKIVQIVRLGINNFYYYNRIKKINNNKKIFIFGTSIHRNLGDHLITLSETLFLKKKAKGVELCEIPTEVYEVYKKLLIKKINHKDLIIINGGGWMGNLWEKEEYIIEDVVSSFKNNKIIIFPQTIYYDKELSSYNRVLSSSIKTFSAHNNLTICVREQQSYNFAKENYTENKVLLVPDIALYYYKFTKKYRMVRKPKILKKCLRNDRENTRNDKLIDNIVSSFQNNNYSIEKVDTISKFRVSEFKRKKALTKKFREFSKCSVVITDRLHGMIFSYLTGTPCIIIENKTKKVSGVYEKWLFKSDLIFPLYKKNDSDLTKFILEIHNNIKNNEINIDFNSLSEEVKEWQKLKD